jgi:hypothetical protein
MVKGAGLDVYHVVTTATSWLSQFRWKIANPTCCTHTLNAATDRGGSMNN